MPERRYDVAGWLLARAANNDDHFAAPGRSDTATGSGFSSAVSAYRHLHQVALDEACPLGGQGRDISHALAREAAAQHYLTDAFSAGHVRTPVDSIRRCWKAAHPDFWEKLQLKVAADTASALRELGVMLRLLPGRFVHRRALSVVRARTSLCSELSVGDLVARVFHDWDNAHGLSLDGGGLLYGDGHIDQGATTALAVAAVRAGNDDVEVAFGLGASCLMLSGEDLYRRVREATGAAGDAFVAEERLPRLSPDNEQQNWRTRDAASLWAAPMVGATGTTVGDALIATTRRARSWRWSGRWRCRRRRQRHAPRRPSGELGVDG